MSDDKQAAEGFERGRKLQVKVGAFVVGTLLLAVGMLFLLGEKKQVFESRATLTARFERIEGLVEGAPVRLAGVNVGTVSRVGFAHDPYDPRVVVKFEVSKDALARMHTDSIARIGSQGLLGDKIIEISVGTPGREQPTTGSELATVEPADFDRLMAQAGKILERAQEVAVNVQRASDALADPKTIESLQGSLRSAHHLLLAAEKGPGLAHAIFYDPRTAHDARQLVSRVDRLAEHVDEGVEKIDEILAHTDGDGRNVVNNLSRAARNMADAAGDLHDSRVVANLDAATGDLAALTRYVRAGQGTLGALIVDPSAYEKLLTVLGGVGRSRILRAMVRIAIARDGDQDKGRAVSADGLVPLPATPAATVGPSLLAEPPPAAAPPAQRRARRPR